MLEHLPKGVISSSGIQTGCSMYVFDYLDERNGLVKSIIYFDTLQIGQFYVYHHVDPIFKYNPSWVKYCM
jgi:hypothetical protein